jgi:hypothetical protein
MSIDSCSSSSGPTVTKDISIQGLKPYMSPEFIQVFPNGDLLIGGGAHAWAARLSPQGGVMWLWESLPGDTNFDFSSKFESAGFLSDGRIILCGKQQAKRSNMDGVLTTLNSGGSLIETQIVVPPVDRPRGTDLFSITSTINGIVVLGTVAPPITGWMQMRNESGVVQWEMFGSPLSYWLNDVIQNPDGTLTALEGRNGRPVSDPGAVTVQRLDPAGNVFRTHIGAGENPTLLKSADPSKIFVLAYTSDGEALVSTLNDKLEEVGKPKTVGGAYDINATRGGGYVLSDGTLALFGKGSDYTAAVARKGPHGSFKVVRVGQPQASPEILNAAQISPTQFVTIRLSVSGQPLRSTVDVAWIEF